MLRRLLTLCAILVALATALWFASATALRQAARDALAAPDAPISAAGVDVTGFPAALTLVLRQPVVTDPGGLWQWTAPRADLTLAARAPTTLRATLPPAQALSIAGTAHEVRTTEAGAEVTLTPSPSLRLRRFDLRTNGLVVTDLLGAQALAVTLVQDSAQPEATLTVNGTGLTLPPALRAALPPGAALPDTIARMAGQARLRLDRPLDRLAAEGAPVRLMAVDLDDAQLGWGDLALRAQGAVQADAQGLAEGRVMLRVTGWRVLMPLLGATGAVKPEVVPTIENALSRLQITPPDGGAPYLELPLIFRAGRTSLGPLPLGAAPRLYLQ